MSRVNDNGGFGEGWQKTSKRSYADTIHQQGNSARQTQQLVDKAHIQSTEASKASESVQQQNNKPVANATELPKSIVNSRVDTQSQSAVAQARSTAAEQCVSAKDNARILSQLTTKAQPTNNADVATRNAVIGQQQTPQADVGRNLPQQPNLAANLAQAAQNAAGLRGKVENTTSTTPRTQPKAAERNEQSPEMQKNPQALDQGAKVNATAVANNAAKPVDANKDAAEVSTASSDVDGEENRAEEEDQAPGSSRFAHGPTAGRSASKELGSLLGGSAGEGDGGQEQGDGSFAIDAAAMAERPALPETDPNFQVFSEFASDDPRIEFIKSRAQVYTRFVEKKLEKIAQLDTELDGRIKEMFETTPLSQRILGDDADAIKATDFLKSVYGGLIA